MKKWIFLVALPLALALHFMIVEPWFKRIVDDPKMKHFGELYGPVSFFYGPYRVMFWATILGLVIVVFLLFRK
jgi:hypothetical protein